MVPSPWPPVFSPGLAPARRNAPPTSRTKGSPAELEIDWSRPPEEIVNHVRALSPHIGARALVAGRRLLVWRVRDSGTRRGPPVEAASLYEDLTPELPGP